MREELQSRFGREFATIVIAATAAFITTSIAESLSVSGIETIATGVFSAILY
jgi:hypothetical protein